MDANHETHRSRLSCRFIKRLTAFRAIGLSEFHNYKDRPASGSVCDQRCLNSTNKSLLLERRRRRKRLSWSDQRSGQLVLLVICATLSTVIVSDVSRLIKRGVFGDKGVGNLKVVAAPAWASWIGEVPTAAELYGDGSSDSPTAEAFDDDDEDEELDASASNEYPDNENDNDESYDDAEDDSQRDESQLKEHWLPAPSYRRLARAVTPAARVGGHAIWSDLEGWRRNKRDLEDRLVLASKRAAMKRRQAEASSRAGRGGGSGGDEDEFAIEDADEDAWVHDGVDDIHIDPETKRAASELSYDKESIDAEYEPQNNENNLVNRTRITTITDVIPMKYVEHSGDGHAGDGSDVDGQSGSDSASQLSSRLSLPAVGGRAWLVPASHLSLAQVQQLMEQQQQQQNTDDTSASTLIEQRVRRPLSGGKTSWLGERPTIDGAASYSSADQPAMAETSHGWRHLSQRNAHELRNGQATVTIGGPKLKTTEGTTTTTTTERMATEPPKVFS